jgi:hypothetical protein
MKKEPPTVEEQHQIAADIVGAEISWENDGRGYFLCPMAEGHSTPTKDKHTVCYLDGVPTFFCWHDSCKEWMADASSKLRSKLDFRTDEELAEARLKSYERSQLDADARRLRLELPRIYRDFAWDGLLESHLSDPWECFLGMWDWEDVIWVGDVWDTGEKGEAHFKTVNQWWETKVNFYANRFTTGSTYKPGSLDRKQSNILCTKYTVIEFDCLDTDKEINKRKGAATLNYLRRFFDLRMIVDSGNKSVHGHFINNSKLSEKAKFFLRQLGADIQTMRPSQPVRLPGGRRENGKIQSVLWVNNEL